VAFSKHVTHYGQPSGFPQYSLAESVEQSFLIISKFEKASGSKINYEKIKGLFIGRLRGKRPRLTNISWISDNIKTLGVFHGYDI
jgi:hypothetical protein